MALKNMAIAGVVILSGIAGPAHAISFYDKSPDGAVYTMSWSDLGSNKYQFTFTANFTGAAGSAALGDYVAGLSIASQPGNINWTEVSLDSVPAPGATTDWDVFLGVVTDSGGCPAEKTASKDWCIGQTPSAIVGPTVATAGAGSVLTWQFTLQADGVPTFNDPLNPWSYKFVTTTGTFIDAKKGWEFGNYQISRTFGYCVDGTCEPGDELPEPGTLVLLGLGLIGLGFSRRRALV